jgi:hypothetical protein
MDCLDYRKSFLRGTVAANNVRLWIESRVTIFDESNGTSTIFYQCASCKAEDTFSSGPLFFDDNYDFLPIFGDSKWLVFRRRSRVANDYRISYAPGALLGEPELLLAWGINVRKLTTWDDVLGASKSAAPIVSQTEIFDRNTKMRALVECPVKSLNISPELQMYQVDTGPVIFPDLKMRDAALIDRLHLAFVAFNNSTNAYFLIEVPTEIACEPSTPQVYHYSKQIGFSNARNVLLAHD